MDSEKVKASPNDVQIGGSHYKHAQGEQHWDRVHRLGMNWFAANVTKYVERYPLKNGLQDLLKARHYLDKLIEVEQSKIKTVGKIQFPSIGEMARSQQTVNERVYREETLGEATSAYVNQDRDPIARR